ncbi:MAG: transglutaminase family protein [Spirochaetia bacterium]|nr:transglutaminase family protein [Spirochaetia bacterium]
MISLQMAWCQIPRTQRPNEVFLREHFLVKLKGARIGTYSRTVKRLNSGMIETNVSFEISVRRFDQALSITRSLNIQEDEAGQIESFELRLNQSAAPTVIQGKRSLGRFFTTMMGAGPVQKSSRSIPSELIGPWKTELKQRSLGFAEGTQYRITVLSPTSLDDLYETYEIKMDSRRKWHSGEHEIDVAVMRANTIPPGTEELNLVDSNGSIVYQESAGYTMERTDETTARAEYDSSEVIDLLLVRPEGILKNPRSRFKAEFSVTSEQGPPRIESSPYQNTRVEGQTLYLKIDVPEVGGRIVSQPGDRFLLPDPYITSEDPAIIKLARSVVGTEKDPWKKVEILNNWVFTNIKKKNYTLGYASASEVVRDLEGDCTEHSVLFAALARALGIPTRVVMGLVYIEAANGPVMIFHQWAEVRFDTWIPVDPTFGLTRADAGRIVIAPMSNASQAEMKRAERAIIEWCSGVRVKVISE